MSEAVERAGRPRAEAKAAGELFAARYATRASRFGNSAGSALDLFRAEPLGIRRGAPNFVSTGTSFEQPGMLRLAADATEGLRTRLRDAFARVMQAAPTDAEKLDLGEITPEGAAQINALLRQRGIDTDVSGYHHEVGAYAAREASRGQLPLTAEDWAAIPDVLSAPDRVAYVERTRQGRDGIGYWKQINGHLLYVEEVRTGRRSLTAVTMRKFSSAEGCAGTTECRGGDQSRPPVPRPRRTSRRFRYNAAGQRRQRRAKLRAKRATGTDLLLRCRPRGRRRQAREGLAVSP